MTKMRITAIANLSANGKVLLVDHNAIAPQEAINFFVQKAIQTGNLVVGRKTFDVFKQFPGGPKQILPGVQIVVLSSTSEPADGYPVVNSPEEAIEHLKEKGFTEIAVGGGTITYNVFLEKDLITDIIFDIIPVIIGDGGIIGVGDGLLTKFKLEEHKLIGGDVVQIHLRK
jgi:dihydrofolate reductase